ncbi:uncharacterized protein LOC143295792 [Babylonia areolata]|uniref:uncharacterized protein LOC143295792 n=1 Tax=Babylonia areolata TaxID=304850 RepID=UPI003FD159C7
MQVVYSGGSSTPTPSPHLQRKNYGHGFGGGGGGGSGGSGGIGFIGSGYSRPVMPGYTLNHPHHSQVGVVPRPGGSHPNKQGKLTEGDTNLRDSIPAMRRPVAVLCFLLNILLPGMGTLVSGLTVLCGSHVRVVGGSRRTVVCTNTGVALLQFFLTFLMLLGWIWSIMWGTAFLSISKEYYKKERGLEQRSSSQGGPPKASPVQKREHVNSNTPSSRHHSPTTLSSTAAASSSRNHAPSHAPTASSSAAAAAAAEQPHSHRNGLSVNVVGGALPMTCDLYNTPSTSTSSSSSAVRSQPIIVLQEAPVIVNHSDVTSQPSATLMNARTRHEKLMRRRMSDNELSPFILTNERLESIVIHDAPVVRPQRGPEASQRLGESTASSLPSLPKS